MSNRIDATTLAVVCDMAGISAKSHEALQLMLIDGVSQYAAARQCGIPESTVSRARRQLEKVVALGNSLSWPVSLK